MYWRFNTYLIASLLVQIWFAGALGDSHLISASHEEKVKKGKKRTDEL